MRKIKALLQRLLARAGFQLTRLESAPPPSVTAYLLHAQTRAASPLSVIGFDNDTIIQSEILAAIPAERVTFHFPVGSPLEAAPATAPRPLAAPAGTFLVVIDIEAFTLESLIASFPWIGRAEAILLRARLGSFWKDESDLIQLVAQIQKLGFEFTDTLGSPRLSLLQAPAERVILACERAGTPPPHAPGARARTAEALTYLSAPLVQRRDFKLLAGRGYMGFAGGVFNPGAIIENGQLLLLPQSEQTPWPVQRTDESLFFAAAQPLLLSLTADHHIARAQPMTLAGLPDAAVTRAGDFRLFRFCGKIYSNHFVMRNPQQHSVSHQPLQMEHLQTRVGISQFDPAGPQLTWLGFPNLDRPLAPMEKNWAMFATSDRLFLLYSFSPYVVLSANHWPGLDFTTTQAAHLTLPLPADDLPWRNSINPVDYDADHWLHIVHRVYPGKQYAFWAVLISKQTLLPVCGTNRPLVRGWHSHPAAIIYTCSAVVNATEVLLCAGLDDAATAIASISRQQLDAAWVPISSQPVAPGR